MRLLKLLKESYGENTVIIQGYNTDAICVLNPGQDCQIRGNTIEFTYYMIGNIYKKPEEEHSYIERLYRDNITLPNYDKAPGDVIWAEHAVVRQLS